LHEGHERVRGAEVDADDAISSHEFDFKLSPAISNWQLAER
jgi:hypothetical protein